MNAAKSCFLVGNKVFLARRRVISRVTGFFAKDLPVTYLGCPLYVGRWLKGLFNGLLDKFSQRLTAWRDRWLSMSARALLIKHVLTSISIHLLAVLVSPRGVVVELVRLFAQSLGGSQNSGLKHWTAWSQLCRPVEEGGVGFRSLETIIDAFSCKLWWLFRGGQSLWAQFMWGRYVGGLHPNQVAISPKFSASCTRMFGVRCSMKIWLQ